MERSLSKDPVLRKRYAYTKREDIKKSHLVTFKSQDPRLRFDLEWYLQHHPVISPNKPGKVRRVFNDAAKLHAPFLNQSLLVGQDLLQNPDFRNIALPTAQVRRLNGYRGCDSPGRITRPRSIFASFSVAGRIPHRIW